MMGGVESRALLGAAAIAPALLLGHVVLYRSARREAKDPKNPPVFLDLIVTGDDNRYSLSRFQSYLWTIAIAITFGALSIGTMTFADVPGNLILLMGISLGTSVVSTAIVSAQSGSAPLSRATRPSFVRDVFFESSTPGSLDLPRVQAFFWTVAALIIYLARFHQLLQQIEPTAAGPVSLPDVPNGMVALMGVSQGTYLGAKAAAQPKSGSGEGAKTKASAETEHQAKPSSGTG
jgi:hypothetical protein